MAEPHETTAAAEAHDEERHEHIVPLSKLAAVFIALLVLTFLTVAATWVDLGEFNLVVALVIAVIKGALVVAVFMHLWWESRFNAIALSSALAFVALFIGLSILDAAEYKPNVEAYKIQHPARLQTPAGSEAGAASAAEPTPEPGAQEQESAGPTS